MDVLLVNFTLKDIKLYDTPLSRKDKDVVINKQLEKNLASKELHDMELEMAKPTSARVIFCGSPYAGMSPISIGPIKQLHQFVFHLKLNVFA
jgi:ABC-type lipopolysaccharide export system ATPase subunit